MRSKIIGTVSLRREAVAPEVELIMGVPDGDRYSEFTVGTWKSFVLWNGSGEQSDTVFRDYEGPLKPTPLGARLEYINSLIEATFKTERLRWVRAFLVQDGMLLPHRDFLEFTARFTRLNLPLRTDPTCLHSEGDWAFHMRAGEVWHLAAETVHSACSLSRFARLSLCLDFEHEGAPDALLKNLPPESSLPRPALTAREELGERQLNALYGLGDILSRDNFRDILQVLAKVHFYRRAHAASVYDWLIGIAERSGDAALFAKAVSFRRYCIEERAVGERFEL